MSRWITVKGTHVLIKDGQTVEDALDKHFGKRKEGVKEEKSKDDYNDVMGASADYQKQVDEKHNKAVEHLKGLNKKIPQSMDEAEELWRSVFDEYDKEPTKNNEVWGSKYQPIYDSYEAIYDKFAKDEWVNNKKPSETLIEGIDNADAQEVIESAKEDWVTNEKDEKIWNSLSNDDKYLLGMSNDIGFWYDNIMDNEEVKAHYDELVAKFNGKEEQPSEEDRFKNVGHKEELDTTVNTLLKEGKTKDQIKSYLKGFPTVEFDSEMDAYTDYLIDNYNKNENTPKQRDLGKEQAYSKYLDGADSSAKQILDYIDKQDNDYKNALLGRLKSDLNSYYNGFMGENQLWGGNLDETEAYYNILADELKQDKSDIEKLRNQSAKKKPVYWENEQKRKIQGEKNKAEKMFGLKF